MVKKAQTGIEYVIVFSFVTFVIITVSGLAYVYSGLSKDKIKVNQGEALATEVINAAESVFFAGEPSATRISVVVPKGVINISVVTEGIEIVSSTSSGNNLRFFESRVPLQGNISSGEGRRTINIQAKDTYVLVWSV